MNSKNVVNCTVVSHVTRLNMNNEQLKTVEFIISVNKMCFSL